MESYRNFKEQKRRNHYIVNAVAASATSVRRRLKNLVRMLWYRRFCSVQCGKAARFRATPQLSQRPTMRCRPERHLPKRQQNDSKSRPQTGLR